MRRRLENGLAASSVLFISAALVGLFSLYQDRLVSLMSIAGMLQVPALTLVLFSVFSAIAPSLSPATKTSPAWYSAVFATTAVLWMVASLAAPDQRVVIRNQNFQGGMLVWSHWQVFPSILLIQLCFLTGYLKVNRTAER